MNDNEHVYEIIAQEIAEKQLRPGVWTQAFGQASGNHERALALYIELRKEQIQQELLEESAREAQRRMHAAQQAEEVRQKEEQRKSAEQYYYFINCDKCHTALRVSKAMSGTSVKCPECEHILLVESAHKFQRCMHAAQQAEEVRQKKSTEQFFYFTNCDKCHATLRVSKAMSGTPVKCPKCKHIIQLKH